MKKLVLLIAVIFAILAPHATQGQNTETRYVRVRVVNGFTLDPVKGATVTFAVPYGQTAEVTTTNSDGFARLKLVQLPDNITVTKRGYSLASTTVDQENFQKVIVVYVDVEQDPYNNGRPTGRRRKR